MAPRRLPTVVEDDTLLSAAQCCRKLGGLHIDNWARYWMKWPALCEGARVVRAKGTGRGRMRWLRSSVVRHITVELLEGAPRVAPAEPAQAS